MNSAGSRLIFAAACFLVFVIITLLVFLNIAQSLDAQLALAINHFYLGGPLTEFMKLSAEYGREYFWIPVVAAMLVFGNRGTKLLAIELAALFIVGTFAAEAIKLLVYRPRPYETIDTIIRRLPVSTGSSYPSGHALFVSVGAVFSLVKFKRKIIAALLSLEAAFVCYSRVYVGLHYPFDVVASIFLAVGIVEVGSFVLERYLDKPLKSVVALVGRIFKDGPLAL